MAAFGCSSPPALLDGLAKVIVGSVTPRVLAGSGPSPFILVDGFGITDGRFGGHPIPHVSSRPSFFSQPSVVGEQIGDIFGLLTDIGALVLAIFVDVLELLESLDNVDIVAEVYDDVFRACVQAIIKKG